MILILSDILDQSTNDLIDWANFYNKETLVVTNKDRVNLIEIDVVQLRFKLLVNDALIDSREISYFIYRKGNINLTHELLDDSFKNENFRTYLDEELHVVRDYIFYILQKQTKKYIGDYFHKTPNKLLYLSIAHSVGLDIPDTYITSKKETVEDLLEKYDNSLITKAISESYGEINENLMSYSYTSAVNDDMVKSSSKSFFPSLFQNRIDKIVELRVFFIENTFFPMAMFYSNSDTDYRDDYNKIARMTPFVLPNDIEVKLKNFIRKTQLTTGSIDLMLGNDNIYYFLEINPNGQFGFVSDSCNYNIEKKIIEVLISNPN